MDAVYAFDPRDPRAPSQEVWERLSPEERQRIVDALPSEFPLATPPEGDLHRLSKERAFQALDGHFKKLRRRVYLSSELPVYYPDEAMFAPDIIAVLDVEPHPRRGWVVSREGRGLDFVLEIHAFGSARKDLELNVERFSRLGIPEYFVYDPERGRLLGWRLRSETPAAYRPIVPQGGRWSSEILGLELALVGGTLRFFHGWAELLDGAGLIDKLSTMVDAAVRRAEDESRRAEDESRRAERLAARLRELGVDPE